MLIIVGDEYFMLELIFDNRRKPFFEKKKHFSAPKVVTLRLARYIQIFCLSTLNLINQRNVWHIKLLKYCDLEVRLPKTCSNSNLQVKCAPV